MARRAGFSLIEMLTVIVIILLLLGLLLPAIARIFAERKVVLAKKEVRALKAALEDYQRDFGSYPPDTGNFSTGDLPETSFDPDSLYKYLSIRQRDRKTGVLGGPYYSFTDPDHLRGPNKMTFVDPWGKPYQMDADHSHYDAATETQIKRGQPYPAGGDESIKTLGVKVWSSGPDGKDATGSNQLEGKGSAPEDQDNIGSWTE